MSGRRVHTPRAARDGRRPAFELETDPVTVRRTRVRDIHVLTVRGVPDEHLLAELCDHLDAINGEPVAVDLSDVTMSSPEIVRDVVTLLADTCPEGTSCIVSRRPSARVVLRRVGHCHVPLFATIADAALEWNVGRHERPAAHAD